MITAPAASKSILLPQLLAFLIPVILGAYWFGYTTSFQSATILLFRPLLVVLSIALTLLSWYRISVTLAEQKLVAVLATLCVVLLAPSLTATDPFRALQEWVWLSLLR